MSERTKKIHCLASRVYYVHWRIFFIDLVITGVPAICMHEFVCLFVWCECVCVYVCDVCMCSSHP